MLDRSVPRNVTKNSRGGRMSSNADEPRPIQRSNPPTADIEDMRLDFEDQDFDYIGRMQQLGFMDQFGRWTDKGIRECLK